MEINPKILRLFDLSLEDKDATPHHLSFLQTADPPLPSDPLRQSFNRYWNIRRCKRSFER